ncbi:MAG: hypothetical protein LJE65_03640 [Desulfobacteraceae bacterium]|jgi:hypothetical protein|nr:hypothetical protein [Desulfobacteraceae bacterium]
MNESHDIQLIDTVKMLADRHGCRLADVDPENRIVRNENDRGVMPVFTIPEHLLRPCPFLPYPTK